MSDTEFTSTGVVSPWLVFCLWSAFASALPACEQRTVPPDITPDLELLVAGQVSSDLDILFVIDNSQSMQAWQGKLLEQFPTLIESLHLAEGGLPNVHIGVVTTDLGAGSQYGIAGCENVGENGILRQFDGDQCTRAPCNFIEDVGDPTCIDPDPRNCRRRNYASTMEEAFRSLADVGVGGCEYIEPLEAMRRALVMPANQGFLRPNAALAVVIVTDSDDCSVSDMAVLDPMAPPVDPLQRPTPIRCFANGVVCDAGDPLAFGSKSGCVADEDSEYLYPPSEYVAFLKALKAEQNQPVFFAAISGPTDAINVIRHPVTMLPTIEPSCSLDPMGPGARDAEPAVRLQATALAFGAKFGQFLSLCDDDLAIALDTIADQLNESLKGTCLVGDLYDSDGVGGGVQPVCTVIESDAQGNNAVYIQSCQQTGAVRPCFETFEDVDECAGTETNLSMVIHRDTEPRPGTVVAMACDVKQIREGFVKTSYYGCSATGADSGHSTGFLFLLFGLLILARRRTTDC